MTQNLRLNVAGMTCDGCENAVKRALTQLGGVQDVSASHREAAVAVIYDTDKVSPALIREKIEKLGYVVFP